MHFCGLIHVLIADRLGFAPVKLKSQNLPDMAQSDLMILSRVRVFHSGDCVVETGKFHLHLVQIFLDMLL